MTQIIKYILEHLGLYFYLIQITPHSDPKQAKILIRISVPIQNDSMLAKVLSQALLEHLPFNNCIIEIEPGNTTLVTLSDYYQ